MYKLLNYKNDYFHNLKMFELKEVLINNLS